MALKTSVVHRNLDAKLKILGFELYDLLAILLFASIMNLLFGKTSQALLLVFVLPSIVATVLYLGKRNKPDNFLIHVFRYYLLPGNFFPGSTSLSREKQMLRIYE